MISTNASATPAMTMRFSPSSAGRKRTSMTMQTGDVKSSYGTSHRRLPRRLRNRLIQRLRRRNRSLQKTRPEWQKFSSTRTVRRISWGSTSGIPSRNRSIRTIPRSGPAKRSHLRSRIANRADENRPAHACHSDRRRRCRRLRFCVDYSSSNRSRFEGPVLFSRRTPAWTCTEQGVAMPRDTPCSVRIVQYRRRT